MSEETKVEVKGFPTATVTIKTDKIGNTIQRKGVTPAELMFLVADNHNGAGGDPVVKIEVEKKKVRGEVQDKDPTGAPLMTVPEDGNEDEPQAVMVRGWVDSKEDNRALRSPVQERARLQQKYGRRRIAKFYPGTIPQFPQSFEEARAYGVDSSTLEERLLSVGDVQQ